MKKTKIKAADIARCINVSPQYIGQLKRKKAIRPDPDGFFHLDDPTLQQFLRARGVDPSALGEDGAEAFLDDDLPPELRDLTLRQLISLAIPHGGRNVPPATWQKVWRIIETAKLYYHGTDPALRHFEAVSGLPARYSELPFKQAVLAMAADLGRLSSPPPWQVIFEQLRAMFKIVKN